MTKRDVGRLKLIDSNFRSQMEISKDDIEWLIDSLYTSIDADIAFEKKEKIFFDIENHADDATHHLCELSNLLSELRR